MTSATRRELPWLALVALSLLFGSILSWQRLGNPLVDCGREMNQPLRLLNGERLYADVQHYYGPFSPHANAVLLELFGVHLDVLRAGGALATVLIVGLVYWLARRLAGRAGAATAALAVTWLCALQRDGNFILPYSYSAVHGSALALAALACAVKAVERPRAVFLLLAGACAGAAFTAKTEMGAAAVIAGTAAAVLAGPLRPGPLLRRAFVFLLPAVLIPTAVYGLLAARVGTRALFEESFLLYRHLPAPVILFNRWSLGLDHPWHGLARMALMLVVLASTAALIVLTAMSLTRRGTAPRGWHALALRYWAWPLAGGVFAVAGSTGLELGSLAATPLILLALLLDTLVRAVRRWRRHSRVSPRSAVVIASILFALASLARTALFVRTGDSYIAFLLPAALAVLAYAWTWRLPALLRRPTAARLARRLATAMLLVWIAVGAAFAQQRLRTRHIFPIVTPRGTLLARPDRGQAFVEAIRFVEQRTRPGDPVAILPEGTSILFFTDRRNPLKEEVATPGLLDEERALRQLESSGTRLVLITNRPTGEYGPRAFGRDYDQRTMQWILDRFRLCGVFGPNPRPQRQIGAGQFFIKAYCRP